VLILTQEASVATVSVERDRLSSAYHFSLPHHAVMADLLDKLRFQALAELHGYPVPRAVRLTNSVGVDALRDLRFPCVLKPTTKHPEYGKRFAKAYKVATIDDVASLWSSMQEIINEIVVQEWVEGSDSDVYFCLQYRPPKGGAGLSFVGRKICQWPVLVGGTASCIPAPEAGAELISLTDRFFGVVGFVGVGSMEYKRDRRDGKFYMIEPTVGRTDYQEEIASLNGVNIPLAVYRGELGAALPDPVEVKPPRAWRDPMGYARARMAGAPDPMLRLSPDIKTCDAYFRLDDPLPYVALKLQALRRRLAQWTRS
jgi:predicted ATP-grasp superfamily ATP-dependent carboligase